MSKPVAYRFKSPLSEEGQWEYGKEPPVGSRWEIQALYRVQVNVPRTPLEKAAKAVLSAWDDPVGMPALCRALDALRAALERPTVPSDCANNRQSGPQPAAWTSKQTLTRLADFDGFIYEKGGFDDAVALYTAPPQRKPLTDDAYRQLMKHAHRLANDGHGELAQYLRDAIDIAHGIGGTP